jgi:ABC-type transport system involved in cytochrome c biogenesis permease subunit
MGASLPPRPRRKEHKIEPALLWAAAVAYGAAGAVAAAGAAARRSPGGMVLVALAVALTFHGAAIAVRWQTVGHGPYTTMFEILSSNVWSLSFVFSLAYWRVRDLRVAAAPVLAIIVVMVVWMLGSDRSAGHVPPTYGTVWLWVHMLFGKVFLGGLLVAVGLAGFVLARRGSVSPLSGLPDNETLDAIAYRFMSWAFVCETFMLIVGAVWAQDAWGRYWAWDPLETWAFLTWLSLAFALHARSSFRLSLQLRAAMALPVFVLAFLTFFGVPFVSQVPHQGAL